jgi:hypothetical protein
VFAAHGVLPAGRSVDESRLPANRLDGGFSGGPLVQALRLESISDIAVMVL